MQPYYDRWPKMCHTRGSSRQKLCFFLCIPLVCRTLTVGRRCAALGNPQDKNYVFSCVFRSFAVSLSTKFEI